MTTSETYSVGDVTLFKTSPTDLSFQDLFSWVIWQFPRPQDDGLAGAVHPSVPDHGWYPAIVCSEEEVVHVHAHIEEPFATPEAAVAYFNHDDS